MKAEGGAPMQTVGDLRTLVTRRAGLRRKVALLAADPGLSQALEQNGCTVLADPASLDEVTAFAPQVVVAFDGFAADGGEGFRKLAQAAPGAELVFSFANASSASVLIRALLGVQPGADLQRARRAHLAARGRLRGERARRGGDSARQTRASRPTPRRRSASCSSS